MKWFGEWFVECRLLQLSTSLFALLSLSVGEAMELKARSANHSRCMFGDRFSCKSAHGSDCEWCELPQECYHKEMVEKLGANCNGSQQRKLKEVRDCADITNREKCCPFDHCRWCISDVLYDGCFKAWEARRLPSQVFECREQIQWVGAKLMAEYVYVEFVCLYINASFLESTITISHFRSY